MGQFEKIVVLSVIGLIAVILVLSLRGEDDPLAGLPGDGAEVLAADAELHGPLMPGVQPIAGRGSQSAPAPEELDLRNPFGAERGTDPAPVSAGTLQTESAPRQEELLLSTRVGGTPEDPRLAAGLPAGAALRSLRGLADTWEPDLKQYTCRRGESFAGLAERFYGSADLEPLLRQSNEGVGRLEQGQVLLVPVFDLRRAAAVAPDPAAAASAQVPGAAPGIHVVGEGENLWGIAKQHYGKGSLWNRVYEANRDRLPNPDSIRAGMQLVIP